MIPTRPLRSIFFLSNFGGGGAEMHTLRLLQSFDRQQIQPMLAVARGGGSYESRLPSDVPLIAFHSRTRSAVRAVAGSVLALRRLIRREQPDVVCGVMDLSVLAVLAATAGLGSRPRVVGMIQVAPREAARNDRLGPLILSGIRHTYQWADGFVALSEGVRQDLIELNGSLHDRIRVIPNAILDDFLRSGSRVPVTRPQDRKVIVACGRLLPQKGFPYLLRAFAQIHLQLPAELWILGEGPDLAALEEEARTLGITERVRFLGFQDNPFAIMAAADLFVLSSLFEGFGNVVVEAMACGTPVVASDCPHGPSEIIKDGVNGLLVPVANSRALAEAMLRVLTQPELHASLKRHGLARAQDYRADTVAARYAQALQEITGGLPPKPRAAVQRPLSRQ